jgi:hypothetical protein
MVAARHIAGQADIDHDSQVVPVVVEFWKQASLVAARTSTLTWRTDPPSARDELHRWLARSLDRLAECGYPLEVASPQKTGDIPWTGAPPDLICRQTAPVDDWSPGDWILIYALVEPAGQVVADDVARNVDVAKHRLAEEGEAVAGLVVAAGALESFWARADQVGVEYVSLAALGYYDDLFGTAMRDPQPGQAEV